MTTQETPLDYSILLYYKFIRVENPQAEVNTHLKLCKELGLFGRILIANEGINGTVSGTHAACDAYIERMNQHPLFADIVYKRDAHHSHAFKRISVKLKDELVTLRQGDVSPLSLETGGYLSPKEFRAMMDRDDVIIVDGRADYEYDVGHFRGAIRPDIDSFRDFPAWIEEHLADAKGKTMITYCTGGIRCEKLTSYLKKEGFTDVYQLDGGIVTYGADPDVKGDLWDGVCYVFDERIVVDINHTDSRTVIGKCYHCSAPTETYINCAAPLCHKQHLVCEPCNEKMAGWCSEDCA